MATRITNEFEAAKPRTPEERSLSAVGIRTSILMPTDTEAELGGTCELRAGVLVRDRGMERPEGRRVFAGHGRSILNRESGWISPWMRGSRRPSSRLLADLHEVVGTLLARSSAAWQGRPKDVGLQPVVYASEGEDRRALGRDAAAVDRFSRSVAGAGAVEVGQDVASSPAECAPGGMTSVSASGTPVLRESMSCCVSCLPAARSGSRS
jgi:hypothetical protein